MERRMRGKDERSGEVLSSRTGDRERSLIVVGGGGGDIDFYLHMCTCCYRHNRTR